MHRRATIVLIFVAAVGLLLLRFPGPTFRGDTKGAYDFTPLSSENMPMDSDDAQILDLRRQARSALAALQSQKPEE
jgi:hypothetical protein